MSIWFYADAVLLMAMIPCLLLIFRGRHLTDYFVGLQMAGLISVLVLMILVHALHRPSFYDLSLALALLSFPSALLFAHFMENWLR